MSDNNNNDNPIDGNSVAPSNGVLPVEAGVCPLSDPVREELQKAGVAPLPPAGSPPGPPPVDERFIGFEELLPYMGVSAGTLRTWIKNGTIPSLVPPKGRRRLFFLPDCREALRRYYKIKA